MKIGIRLRLISLSLLITVVAVTLLSVPLSIITRRTLSKGALETSIPAAAFEASAPILESLEAATLASTLITGDAAIRSWLVGSQNDKGFKRLFLGRLQQYTRDLNLSGCRLISLNPPRQWDENSIELTPPRRTSPRDRLLYTLIDSKETRIHRISYDPVSMQYTLLVAAKIFDSGKTVGAALINREIPVADLSGFPAESRLLISDSFGEIFYPEDSSLMEESLPVDEAMLAELKPIAPFQPLVNRESDRADLLCGEANGFLITFHTRRNPWYANRLRTFTLFNIILSITAILFSAAVFAMTSGRILLPLRKLSQAMAAFRKNKKSEVVLDFDRNDELGMLAQEWNRFSDEMNSLIESRTEQTESSRRVNRELNSFVSELDHSVKGISVRSETAAVQMDRLTHSIEETGKTTSDIKASIQEINHSINEQAAAVTESSSVVEQMIHSVQTISRLADSRKGVLSEMTQRGDAGRREILELTDSIQQVNRSIELIQEMADLINQVAARTNLLSMNAAIEAAHAGEAGKGFAVVAEEIRKLSEETASNSRTITDSLERMMETIASASDRSKRSSETINTIISGMTDLFASMEEILNGYQEMSTGGDELLRTINMLKETAAKVKEQSDKITDEVYLVEDSMKNVYTETSKTAGGFGEIKQLLHQMEKRSSTLKERSVAGTGQEPENVAIRSFQSDKNHSS